MNLLKTFAQAPAWQPWRQEDISGEGHSLSQLMSHLGWVPVLAAPLFQCAALQQPRALACMSANYFFYS